MVTGNHPPTETGSAPDRMPEQEWAGSSWRRPVRLLGGSEEQHPDFPDPVPAGLRDLSSGQQRIAAAILATLGLTTTAGGQLIDLQRERLRAGALRRGDDIEALTGLIRLLVGSPLGDAAHVADVHCAHQHLRRWHWWPTGPEDLPLAALLVAGAADPDAMVTRIGELHLALSEGDEVPDDPCALVVLCRSVSELSDTQVVLRLCALRAELTLSGLPLQEEDMAAVTSLAAIAGAADAVMHEYVAERQLGVAPSNGSPSPLAIALAGDAVVIRHLDGAARLEYIAALAIRAWMAARPHPRVPSTRFSRMRS